MLNVCELEPLGRMDAIGMGWTVGVRIVPIVKLKIDFEQEAPVAVRQQRIRYGESEFRMGFTTFRFRLWHAMVGSESDSWPVDFAANVG